MTDYIDRQAAIDEIKEIYEWHDNVTKERIIEHFERLPSAEVEPVKHGAWKITAAFPHRVYCSVCYKTVAQADWAIWKDGSMPRRFCPNCGAKMGPISASPENGQEQRRSPDASL